MRGYQTNNKHSENKKIWLGRATLQERNKDHLMNETCVAGQHR